MHVYPSRTTIRLPLQQLKQLHHLELVNSESCYAQVSVMLQCLPSTIVPYGSTPGGSSSIGPSPAASSNSPPAAINLLEYVSSSLTSLKLHRITFQPSLVVHNSYSCITALTALQLLDLKQAAYEDPANTLALTGALPQLTTLTQLHLEWHISNALNAAVGQLTKLQELRLCQRERRYNQFPDDQGAPQLNLPSSLTHLEVELPHSFCALYTPSLSSVTALQHLQLKHIIKLDPTMMKHMTRLTHLELHVRGMSSQSLSQLLDVVPAMQQLQHLQLDVGGESVQHGLDGPVVGWRQCGAFTSSSNLTSLQLSGVRLSSAGSKELFPPNRKLPHLTTLKIRGTACRCHRDGPASQPISGSADMYSLIECFPNLAELDLATAVQDGKSLSCLSHLAHLTALTVGGPTMDNICAAAVAEVTGLEKLTVIDPAPYKHTAADTATWLQRHSGWDGLEQSIGTDDEQGGSFDFRGLRSLMKLKRLQTFLIGRNTFLFGGGYSSDDGYGEEHVRTFRSPVSYIKLANCTLLTLLQPLKQWVVNRRRFIRSHR
jgi:hypothetical protein